MRVSFSEAEAARVPAMPWHLRARGIVLITLHWVEVQRARAHVPPELSIVRVLPDWTIGGLFLAEYGAGSDLEYNELIVCGAAVWHEGWPGAWATHLFVDNPDSVIGGRALLGAPKQLASFAREEGQHSRIRVEAAEGPICRVDYGRQLWLWRQRVRLAALHLDVRDPSHSTLAVHGNELRGRVGFTRATVEIPETSPLHELGFGRRSLSMCARDVAAVLGGAAFLPLHFRSIAPPGSE